MKLFRIAIFIFSLLLLTGEAFSNPLKEKHEKLVTEALTEISASKGGYSKSLGSSYWKLAGALDSLQRHSEAKDAIEKALNIESNNEDYLVTYSHVLRQLGHPDLSLKVLQPLSSDLRKRAAASKSPQEAMILVLGDKCEIFLSEMHSYIALQDFDKAIDSLGFAHDIADAKNFYPYRALWYLTLKAKSGTVSNTIESSIEPSSKNNNRYGKLLSYWLGRGSLSDLSASASPLEDPAEKQDANAEAFFFLAMKERFVNKNLTNYRALTKAINDLSPFGNTEWSSLSSMEIE
jgi:tetratricopeptide (TPR) repeat protein